VRQACRDAGRHVVGVVERDIARRGGDHAHARGLADRDGRGYADADRGLADGDDRGDADAGSAEGVDGGAEVFGDVELAVVRGSGL
jgi:hypothetical protein